jgi:hypothetical protein
VVEAASPAQGDHTLGVGDVVAQAEVARAGTPRRLRLGPGGVGGGSAAPGRPVRPVVVVSAAEGIELGLQLSEGARHRLALQPALQGLLEALDLALRLGMAGVAVLLPDAQVGEQVLEAVAPAGEARGGGASAKRVRGYNRAR